MISKAIAKYLRISPRKTRSVIALIKGKSVTEAVATLASLNKRASSLLTKLLNSAIANAKRFPNVQEQDLYISDIYADSGPQIKRTRAEALGRASVIRKPTSHVTIELDARVSNVTEQPKRGKRIKFKRAGAVKQAAHKQKPETKTGKAKRTQAKSKKGTNR